MQIFIGNLSKMATPRHLADLFLPFGMVRAAKIISGGLSGRSLGFGYIEMESKCGKLAIQRLDRMLFMNAYIEVNEVH